MHLNPIARIAAVSACAVVALFAQAPTINPRGVINAVTQAPAPSRASAGGVIWIDGANLGPATALKATTTPLPTSLSNPAIQVTVNGRAAALFSVSATRIVAQIPWATAAGLASIAVKRGPQTSNAAKIYVDLLRPGIRTAGDLGFGPADSAVSGSTLALSAAGFGALTTRVADGTPGAAAGDAPRAAIYGWVGGSPVKTTAIFSPTRVGEYDVTVAIPPNAQPGDMIAVVANNTAARAVFRTSAGFDVKFVKIPAATPVFRGIAASDLMPGYTVLSAARDAKGCYASILFDAARQSATALDGCLTAPGRATTPFVVSTEGAALAAFTGPPPADPQAPISATVRLLNPAAAAPIDVTLPSPAASIQSLAGGNFSATIPGAPAQLVDIDAVTGQTKDGGNVAAAALSSADLKIDLGDGLAKILTNVINLGQGDFGIIVADDFEKPTIAKWAIVNASGDLQTTKDFPAGLLPLIAPAAPTPARYRTPILADTAARVVYVLTSSAAKQSLAVIPYGNGDISAIDLPAGWFAASCASAIPLTALALSDQIAIYGSKSADNAYKTSCPATGFLLIDPAAKKAQAVELAGQFNAAPGNAAMVNDFIYATNANPQTRAASAMFALDGVAGQAVAFDLPAGVTTFSGVQSVQPMGILIALAGKTAPGDAGFALFDLAAGSSRLLPVPAGFGAVQFMAVFPNQRKLAAKAVKSDNSGSQFVIYDLLTGDSALVPNPAGVAWAGRTEAAGATAAGPALQRMNVKAGTIDAVTYDTARRETGLMSFRVP